MMDDRLIYQWFQKSMSACGMIIAGQWHGRPFDDVIRLETVVFESGMLKFTFKGGRKLFCRESTTSIADNGRLALKCIGSIILEDGNNSQDLAPEGGLTLIEFVPEAEIFSKTSN